MAERIPTQAGDVLILATDQAYRVYVVGLVLKDGQQDFHGQSAVTYHDSLARASVAATALLASGRQIILGNIDTGEWSVMVK